MIIGMLLGALCAALWANNVSLRWPTSKRRLLQGLIGGSPTAHREAETAKAHRG